MGSQDGPKLNKGPALVLYYSRWRDGEYKWLAINYEDAKDFADDMDELFTRRFKGLFADRAKTIYEALRLDELGF